MYQRTNDDDHDQLATMIQHLHRLDDAITEHDVDDPNFGDAERWPFWTDLGTFGLGPDPDEFPLVVDDDDDDDDDDLIPLDEFGDFAGNPPPLTGDDTVDLPDPAHVADMLERLDYERKNGCRLFYQP